MLDETAGTSGTQVNNGDDLMHFDLKDILDPAHYVDRFLFICTTILTVVGILINMLVIGAIVFLKRLHFPRIVGWIGIGISNIFVLVSNLMLVVTALCETSTVSTRGFYTWSILTSSFILTLNIVSTVLERCICITYPKWHKRCISIRFILAFEFSMMVIVFIIPMAIANFEVFQPYLSSYFKSWNFKLVGTFFAFIFPAFLTGSVGFLAVFKRQTQQVTTEVSSVVMNRFKSANRLNDDKNNIIKISNAVEKEHKARQRISHFVHVGNNRISEMEMGAKQTFNYLAYIYLISVAPSLISFISVLICLQVPSSSCSLVLVLFYYIGVLMSCLHSGIANPVAFVLLSKDLFSCFKSRACRNASFFKQKFKEDEMASHNRLETICEEPDEETAM